MASGISIILLFIIIALIISIPIGLTLCNIFIMIKSLFKRGINLDNYLVNTIDIIFTIFLPVIAIICVYILKDGKEAIIIHDKTELTIHSVLSHDHMLTIVVILVFSIISFWVLKIFSKKLSPILYLVFSSSLILEIVFTIFFFVQVKSRFNYMVVNIPVYCFANLIFAYIRLLKNKFDEFIFKEKELNRIYENKLIMKLYIMLIKTNTLPTIMVLGIFPIMIVLQLILIIFGQQPDSAIKAFVETSDWTFSKFEAPPPIYVPTTDGHYLCTVALKGHKSIVKPIRYGIRRNMIITVNRQLLVANAFENILEEYTPKLHCTIRGFYDKYGRPICQYINSAVIADFIYIIMKPLEWAFLFCLYAIDKNPENRVAVQYLPRN